MIDMQRTGNYYGIGNALGEISGNVAGTGIGAFGRAAGSLGPRLGYAAAAAGVHAGVVGAGAGIGHAFGGEEGAIQGAAIGDFAGVIAAHFTVTCFRGDTRLLAPSGPRRLDEFAENDLVGARNEHDSNGPLEWKRVVRVFKRVAPIVELEVRGRTIRTTLEHPFHALEQGWRRTGELQPGDLLVCLGPELVAVEAIRDTGEVTTVYNLEVEDHHTYFVTGDDWGFAVWAHNASYDARILAHNLERDIRPRVAGEQAGHVVPTGAFRNRSKAVQDALKESRDILASEGINLNSSANGFWADNARHHGTHTDAYFLQLAERLKSAELAGTVRQTLNEIRLESVFGRFN